MMTCAFALTVSPAFVSSVWWGHFLPIFLPKPFSWQLTPALCSLMPSGRKWTVSVWGFMYFSALVPRYCLEVYLLPSSVYQSGVGSSLSRNWLETPIDTHELRLQFSKCAVRPYQHIWWKIQLVHKESDINVTTKIRSEVFYYGWLTGKGKTQPSALQKKTHLKSSHPHLAIILTSHVVMGQSLHITLHTSLQLFQVRVDLQIGQGRGQIRLRPWAGVDLFAYYTC